jgi:hypothetical protein
LSKELIGGRKMKAGAAVLVAVFRTADLAALEELLVTDNDRKYVVGGMARELDNILQPSPSLLFIPAQVRVMFHLLPLVRGLPKTLAALNIDAAAAGLQAGSFGGRRLKIVVI